jgi:hypothetical protein
MNSVAIVPLNAAEPPIHENEHTVSAGDLVDRLGNFHSISADHAPHVTVSTSA